MSYHLSPEAERRLERAVTVATQSIGLRPKVSTEFLEGPDGSSLHIKLVVDRQLDTSTRNYVVRAATNAAVQTLPELTGFPLVTVMQPQ